MPAKPLAAAILASLLALPAAAQTTVPAVAPTDEYAKGYIDKGSPNAPAVNAQEAPVTAALNNKANIDSVDSSNASQANQAQYDADRAAYVAALVAHDAAVDRSDMRYARQQRAYADAMAVWRVQVQECKKGHRKACDLPPPSVSDYY